ncbi:MAG: hypothetical protein RBS88_02420 [Spongiibacteraceae bacterium]|jgi:hypothetical protein|nr:hypothetical protein [Spongiibacteraceae bacterium]
MSLARLRTGLLRYRSWLAVFACVLLLAQWGAQQHRHESAEPAEHSCVVCLLGQTVAAVGPALLLVAGALATALFSPLPGRSLPLVIIAPRSRGPPA